MADKFNTREFKNRKHKHKDVSVERTSTVLTPSSRSAWRDGPQKKKRRGRHEDGLVGKTAVERRALTRHRTGEKLTGEEKTILSRLKRQARENR